MRILIAPNAFKNSLSAEEAAEAILTGLQQSGLPFSYEIFPIADGGNGTASLIIKKFRGVMVQGEVQDPLGRPISAGFGLIDQGKTAVMEMADASGLQFLSREELNPLRSSSAGTGDLIRMALDAGVEKIILGMGGSATVDGGAGILRALGVRFLDVAGTDLADRPETMAGLHSVDITGLDKRILAVDLIILCDVNNPLLGTRGAAAVFGPQKGATPEAVEMLESALTRLKDIAFRSNGRDMNSVTYGGTAGGAAAGLNAFLNAKLRNGIDYFLQLTGFGDAVSRADLVITGEGSIDGQTLEGKGPFGVALLAKSKGLPVLAVAGKVPLEKNNELDAYFDVLLPIGNEPADLAEAVRLTRQNLIRTSALIGNMLALRPNE